MLPLIHIYGSISELSTISKHGIIRIITKRTSFSQWLGNQFANIKPAKLYIPQSVRRR